MRHFGDNVVTGIRVVSYRGNPSSEQHHLEITSDLEKTNVEMGDSGGPCFREDSSGERSGGSLALYSGPHGGQERQQEEGGAPPHDERPLTRKRVVGVCGGERQGVVGHGRGEV